MLIRALDKRKYLMIIYSSPEQLQEVLLLYLGIGSGVALSFGVSKMLKFLC